MLSAIPGNRMPELSFKAGDKVEHFLAYFSLAFVVCIEFANSHHWLNRFGLWLIYVVLFCSAYGALLEVFQGLFFYQRTFDYADMLANTTGSVIGTLVYLPSSKAQNFWKRLM